MAASVFFGGGGAGCDGLHWMIPRRTCGLAVLVAASSQALGQNQGSGQGRAVKDQF